MHIKHQAREFSEKWKSSIQCNGNFEMISLHIYQWLIFKGHLEDTELSSLSTNRGLLSLLPRWYIAVLRRNSPKIMLCRSSAAPFDQIRLLFPMISKAKGFHWNYFTFIPARKNSRLWPVRVLCNQCQIWTCLRPATVFGALSRRVNGTKKRAKECQSQHTFCIFSDEGSSNFTETENYILGND